MPGMMDTVLNLGLNDAVVEGLAAKRGERFAYDSYRRLLDMFADVVLGVPHEHFEKEIGELKAKRGVKLDVELTAADLKELCTRYKAVYKANNIEVLCSTCTLSLLSCDASHHSCLRIPTSSFVWPSLPSSAPGTFRGPSSTAQSTASLA